MTLQLNSLSLSIHTSALGNDHGLSHPGEHKPSLGLEQSLHAAALQQTQAWLTLHKAARPRGLGADTSQGLSLHCCSSRQGHAPPAGWQGAQRLALIPPGLWLHFRLNLWLCIHAGCHK